MARPYEFADDTKYRDENLWEVIHGGHNLVQESDDIDVIAHVQHTVRHALFEHKQRREDTLRAAAGRIVIEEPR